MNPRLRLIFFLLLLAAINGYLLSKASLVGRVGISLFYRQYQFLKTWWQGGLVVFSVWMLLFFLQGLAQRRYAPQVAKWLHIGAIIVAIAGLFFTYQDFRHTLSHRLLGERFHLGGYLFWIGWIIISLFFVTRRKQSTISSQTHPGWENLPASEKSGG